MIEQADRIAKDLEILTRRMELLQGRLEKFACADKPFKKEIESAKKTIIKWLPEVRVTLALANAMFVIYRDSLKEEDVQEG